MSDPKKVPLKIIQGATFAHPFYWYDGSEVIVPITAIGVAFPAGYPPVLTAASHGLPTRSLPARILGVKGPTALNTDSDDDTDRRYVEKVTADSCKVLDINLSGAKAYTGGGFLVYTPPKNLSSYKARLQVRSSVTSDTVLFEATTENGRIDLTSAEGLIEVGISAGDTEALTFTSAVYDLELVLPGLTPDLDVVTRLAYGPVTVSNEITRT